MIFSYIATAMKPWSLILISFFLLNSSLFSQDAKQPIQEKLSVGLLNKLKGTSSKDSIDIYVALLDTSLIKRYPVIYAYQNGTIYLIRIRAAEIKELATQKQILFVDLYEKPKEELTTATLDLATNKVNLAQRSFPTITGKDLLVSLKENKLDTADLDYIGRYVNTGLSGAIISAHASIMATTIVGAGNTSSFSKGVATGSNITSSSFSSVLPDSDGSYLSNGITVQNHSYGTVVQNYYGIEAVAYDVSANNNTQLLHVFSSGNSGNATGTGTYAGIEGYANLTGNFKHAKNTITVGAIDSFNNVSPLSSKGPAYDGRIKPELVAFGEDGSSGAAAMVSGSALLIQQAYKLKHGVVPSSSTTKAVLINSASDVDAKGLDFASGYGNLNTYNAVKTILDDRFMQSVIGMDEKKSFQVIVPKNAAHLKVTLVWTDPVASVNAPKALINNIDLVVKSPDNQEWLPWVLNHASSKASLQQAAERKKDTVNNVEQVSIDSPIPGTYTIEVATGQIQNNQQRFSIAYQIDTLETTYWTFPAADDKIQAKTTSVIRWESNKTGQATIEYSTDKTIWTSIASLPNAAIGYYKWAVPDIVTTAWLRLNIAGQVTISDTFVISRIPRMDVGFNCADSFLLLWDKQPVTLYEVYELGAKYLQPIAVTTDSFRLLKKMQHTTNYFSVAPLVNGKRGLQASILNYSAKGVDCYFKNFFLQNQDGSKGSFYSAIGTTYGVENITLQKQEGSVFRLITKIDNPTVTEFIFEDPALTQGINRYRLAIQLTNGQTIYSEIIPVYYFNNKDVIIYPNPAAQQQPVHIITGRAGRITIQLYNSSGAMMKEIRLKNLQQEIPPLQLNAGLYLIKIIDEEKKTVSSQKLIVQ